MNFSIFKVFDFSGISKNIYKKKFQYSDIDPDLFGHVFFCNIQNSGC